MSDGVAFDGEGRRIATIDIGTHTLLLLVAEVSDARGARTLRPVHEDCRFGRLGKNLDRTGRLDPGSVEESLRILREYRARIDELGAGTVRAVGTQALREAHNAGDFVEPAGAILGAPIEIIAGEREAQLVYRAAVESFPQLADQTFVVADVGGGSTEIIVGQPRARQPGPNSSSLATSPGRGLDFRPHSVPIGSVRLHERHLRSDPPTRDEILALTSEIDRALATLTLPTGVPLVGTSGTATTLASVELGMRVYDPDRVHGMTLPRSAVERQLDQYMRLTLAERLDVPGLRPERAETIDAGTAIFERLLTRLDASRFIVSERGVRWGLAHEILGDRTS